jgi:hypothetical protein
MDTSYCTMCQTYTPSIVQATPARDGELVIVSCQRCGIFKESTIRLKEDKCTVKEST